MKYCVVCGEEIPEGRIKVLPNAETCVKHSGVEKKKGFVVISGKTTYSELDIVDDNTYKTLSKLDRKGWNAIN